MISRIMTLTLLGTLLVSAQSGVEAAWKNLKSLAGEWQGEAEGAKGSITYTVVSNGNAVMESMKTPGSGGDMVTVYHRDGSALLATHYCSMGNQPRMRAANPGDGPIRFRFADITNLAKPDGGHIAHLTVTFQDADHFTQEWTSTEGGKETPMTFRWTRKK